MILLYYLLKNMITLLIFGKDIKTIAIGKTLCGHDYTDFIQCMCGRKSFMIRSNRSSAKILERYRRSHVYTLIMDEARPGSLIIS